ncbi:DUF5681 domain-containing protein [Gymnodinialimonas ulvae]|uniref:DUF5681 domain-containing protein n=1 Tax=Gymnodinialimonas ulvae TaxID=3126504 RepID=UPI0030AD1C33
MTGRKLTLPSKTDGLDYDVGYGKPPKDTRFKPGQSGNPRGRPKGAKNKRPGLHEERLKDIILDEAYRTVAMREGDHNVQIPVAQAVMRAIAVNAAKGNTRSQRLFAQLLADTETSRKLLHDEWLDTVLEYKANWDDELRRRERLGITDLEAPLPHPDHIVLDPLRGEVRIEGPITKEQHATYERIRQLRDEAQDEVDYFQQMRDEESDETLASSLDNLIETNRGIVERASALLPKEV